MDLKKSYFEDIEIINCNGRVDLLIKEILSCHVERFKISNDIAFKKKVLSYTFFYKKLGEGASSKSFLILVKILVF